MPLLSDIASGRRLQRTLSDVLFLFEKVISESLRVSDLKLNYSLLNRTGI